VNLLFLHKYAFVKTSCIAFIILAYLCFSCKKKKGAVPSAALSYPYTDTFYGVFNDSVHDYVNGVFRDTSFPTVCYVNHLTAGTVDVEGVVSRYREVFNPNSGSFTVFPLEVTFNYDSMRTYAFDVSAIDYYVDSVYVFKSDSFYTINQMNGSINTEKASFAGKGHVH
jgi:hypothetical protein